MPRTRRRRRAAPPPSFPLWLGPIFAAALAVRLLYRASIDGAPFGEILQTNPQRYHTWASLILAGQAPPPPFDQAPGYAYLLALLYSVFGPSPRGATFVQAVLDSAACLFIGLTARRLFGTRAGILAGGLAALCGPLIYFSGEILPATAHVSALSAAVALSLYGFWWPAGILWGTAVVLRFESLLGLPILGLYAWQQGGRRAAVATAVPAFALLLALLGWSSMNSGRLSVPVYGAGMNLWLGNNPHADGVSPFVGGALLPIAQRISEQAENEPLVMDSLFRRRAIRMWQDFPKESLALLWRKLRWTFTARELPNTSDIEWQQGYSWMYRNPFLPLSFGIVLIAACAALPLLPLTWRQLLPLSAGPFMAVVVCLIFFTNSRFRLPMLPSLLVLGGGGLDRLIALTGRTPWRQRQLASMLLAAVAGTWLAYSNPYAVWSYTIPQLDVNSGVAERQAGHFDTAVWYLRRALRSTPEDGIAWVHLALALEQDGDPRGAAEAYLDGLTRTNDAAHLPPMAERFFQRQGLDQDLLEKFRDTESAALRAALKQQILRKLQR